MKLIFFLSNLVRFVYYKFHLNKLYNPYRQKKRNHYKLTLDDIESALKTLDIQKGDSIIVHSAMSYIDEKAETIIEFLKRLHRGRR